MLYIYLAMSGGRVEIPDGARVVDESGDPEIRVVDEQGRVLAIFRRRDVSLYSETPLPGEDAD